MPRCGGLHRMESKADGNLGSGGCIAWCGIPGDGRLALLGWQLARAVQPCGSRGDRCRTGALAAAGDWGLDGWPGWLATPAWQARRASRGVAWSRKRNGRGRGLDYIEFAKPPSDASPPWDGPCHRCSSLYERPNCRGEHRRNHRDERYCHPLYSAKIGSALPDRGCDRGASSWRYRGASGGGLYDRAAPRYACDSGGGDRV